VWCVLNETKLAARGIIEASSMKSVDSALIIGSGWGDALNHVGECVWEQSAKDFVGFDFGAVRGHSGLIHIVLTATGRRVLVLPRAHLYQGAWPHDVAHPVRVATALGAKTIVLTNAAGSTRTEYVPGDIVTIADHINLTGESPAQGFVDMTNTYTLHLQQLVQDIDPAIQRGVYAQFRGPQYETPAEVRMARTLGADLVGMSTALEAIAARECGLDVLGLSLVTNMAAGLGAELSHDDVLATGRVVESRLGELLRAVLCEV
jgi:purine-nucleoside phosphorylase